MVRDEQPVFGSYRDTGYVFGNDVFTCCRNCARREHCPAEKRGKKCATIGSGCGSCTKRSLRGCRYFVLDWGVMAI